LSKVVIGKDIKLGGACEKISAADGPFATHLRYRVLKTPS
jgi:hypothetical protein